MRFIRRGRGPPLSLTPTGGFGGGIGCGTSGGVDIFEQAFMRAADQRFFDEELVRVKRENDEMAGLYPLYVQATTPQDRFLIVEEEEGACAEDGGALARRDAAAAPAEEEERVVGDHAQCLELRRPEPGITPTIDLPTEEDDRVDKEEEEEGACAEDGGALARSDAAAATVEAPTQDFDILVETCAGPKIRITVAPNDLIALVMQKIEDVENIPTKDRHYIYQNKVLQRGSTLADYGIKKETMEVILSFRVWGCGGSKKKKKKKKEKSKESYNPPLKTWHGWQASIAPYPIKQNVQGGRAATHKSMYIGVYYRKINKNWCVLVNKSVHQVADKPGAIMHGAYPFTPEGELAAAHQYDAVVKTYCALSVAARTAPLNFAKHTTKCKKKYIGVSANRRSASVCWMSSVSIANRTVHFGRYGTAKEAAVAFDNGMLRLKICPSLGWNFPASAVKWRALVMRFAAMDFEAQGWVLSATARAEWDALVASCASVASTPAGCTLVGSTPRTRALARGSFRAAPVARTYLVIEITDKLSAASIRQFCEKSKASKKMVCLHPLTVGCTTSLLVIPLVDDGLQFYIAQGLHNRPHYTLYRSGLADLIEQCAILGKPVVFQTVRAPTMRALPVCRAFWLQLKEQLDDPMHSTANFRGTTVQTEGFSNNAQKLKREYGGMPTRTVTNMSAEVRGSCIELLPWMSAQIRIALGFGPRGTSEHPFAETIAAGNYFEAFAAALTRGDELGSHMDRENGRQPGYDAMGALSFAGCDKDGPYRIAVFGYTRKCVGDYLDWAAKEKTRPRKSPRLAFQRHNDGEFCV